MFSGWVHRIRADTLCWIAQAYLGIKQKQARIWLQISNFLKKNQVNHKQKQTNRQKKNSKNMRKVFRTYVWKNHF